MTVCSPDRGLFVPPLEHTLCRSGDDHVRERRPARLIRQLPPPTAPPFGTLETVAGLLLARAVPFDRAVQASIRARWGIGLPAPGVDINRRRDAMGRLRALGTVTPVPGQLLDALALLELPADRWPGKQHDHEQGARVLLAAGLTTGLGGPPLVYGLARIYRLAPR